MMYGDCSIFSYFLITILLHLAKQIQCQVTKCCQINLVLQIRNDYSYFCASLPNQTIWDAYNLPSFALPNCMAHRNVFGYERYIELNGCIDEGTDNEFVAVSCSQNPITGVHLMNKCCPVGQSYDYSERFCRNDPDSYGHFKRLFETTAVIFKNEVPDCSDDEVFVEYFSSVHNIRFEGRNLEVNGDILSPDKFCIEDLIKLDPSEANEYEKHFVVRSCRPRSICSKIPCIRRCCKTDQIMKKVSKPKMKLCLPHPSNRNLIPKFYDVNLPLTNTQKQINLKGMNEIESFPLIYLFVISEKRMGFHHSIVMTMIRLALITM